MIYDVIYNESEEENTVKTIAKVKGINTEQKEKEDSLKVNGSIKDTKIEIEKEANKAETDAGSVNKYKIKVKNTGIYDAREVVIEDTLYGDAKYIKDSLKVIDNAKNVIENTKYNLEWPEIQRENKFKVSIPLIEKQKEMTITYDVSYEDLEETQEITNFVRAKGINTNNAEPKQKNGIKVLSKGVIKNTDIEVTKNTDDTEVLSGNRSIYTITVRNKGQYKARKVSVRDVLKGNSRYIEDTVTVESNMNKNSNNIRNIIENIEWEYIESNTNNFNINIPIIEPSEIYTIKYVVEHKESEDDNETTNTVIVKGNNIAETKSNDVIVKAKGVIKETTLDMTKTSEQKKDTTINTIDITNIGNSVGKNIDLEESLDGNTTILKTSVKILNSKGEDILKTIKEEDIRIGDRTINIRIPRIDKNQSYKIIYEVKIDEPNKDKVITRKTNIKGTNLKQEESINKYNVLKTIKETELDIKKTLDNNIVEAGDRNKYKIVVKNIGENDAKDVIVDNSLTGNAKYLKDSITISDKNIKVEYGKNNKFKIPLLEKGKEITITYKVEYLSSIRDSIVKNNISVKGSNTRKKINTTKARVLGVKENLIEKELLPKILPKAGKRERRQITIYMLAAFIILIPTLIFKIDYLNAKKKEVLNKRRNRRRKTLRYKR